MGHFLLFPCPLNYSFPSSSSFPPLALLPCHNILIPLISPLLFFFFFVPCSLLLPYIWISLCSRILSSKRHVSHTVRKASGGKQECLSGHLITQPQIFQRSLDSCWALTLNPRWFWVGFSGLNPSEALVLNQQCYLSHITAPQQEGLENSNMVLKNLSC